MKICNLSKRLQLSPLKVLTLRPQQVGCSSKNVARVMKFCRSCNHVNALNGEFVDQSVDETLNLITRTSKRVK